MPTVLRSATTFHRADAQPTVSPVAASVDPAAPGAVSSTVAVTVLTFAGTEASRVIVTTYGRPVVQIHHSLAVSSPGLAVLLLTVLITAFVIVRPRPRSIGVALGFYAGGGLANLSELLLFGGVADYIPLLGYAFSPGDLAAGLGTVLAYISVMPRCCGDGVMSKTSESSSRCAQRRPHRP